MVFRKYLHQILDDQGNIRGAKIYDKPAVTSILPSVNVTYSLTEKINLRGSAYKTVNRPEFREIANFSFYNFAINSQFVGNSNLKQADISNYDVRFEFYPTANQIVSVGAFYKKIINLKAKNFFAYIWLSKSFYCIYIPQNLSQTI